MKLKYLFYTCAFMLTFVLSKAGDAPLENSAKVELRSTLTQFINSLKKGQWAHVYDLHAKNAQKVVLGDAFVNLSYLRHGDGPNAQQARKIMELHFDEKRAIKNIESSNKDISKKEKIIICLAFISEPRIFYEKWRRLVIDQDKWSDSIANVEEFNVVTIENGKAVVSDPANLKIEFIRENGQWKILNGWHVSK